MWKDAAIASTRSSRSSGREAVQTVGDVARHRQVGKQCELLKYHAPPAAAAAAGRCARAESNRTRSLSVIRPASARRQAGEAAKDRALAAARRPEQDGDARRTSKSTSSRKTGESLRRQRRDGGSCERGSGPGATAGFRIPPRATQTRREEAPARWPALRRSAAPGPHRRSRSTPSASHPGMLPPTIRTTPNSPIVWANVRTSAERRPSIDSGSVTRTNVRSGEAPSTAEASRKDG